MKLTKPFKTGMLALLCGAIYAPMAQAAYTTGDLLLAFRSTTSTANTFVVDIGQASTYRDSTGTINVTGNLGSTLDAGLTAAFGSGWASDTGLYMGVLATSGSLGTLPGDGSGNASYVGKAGTGVSSDAGFTTLGSASRNSLANAITGFADTGGTGSFNAFVSNSANASNVSMNGNAAVIATSNSNDYTDAATGTGYFTSLPANSDLLVSSALTGSKLDLFRILAQTGTATDAPSGAGVSQFQGSFSISSAGAVSFNSGVVAAPEPSRFVLLGLGLSGCLMRRRRRTAK